MTRGFWLGVTIGLGVGAACGLARAAANDGVYGRLDGDVTVGAALGAEMGRDRPSVAGQLSAHYFWSAGLLVSYRDSLTASGARARIASVSADLRPLFLIRWPRNLERGPAWFDLTVDSCSLNIGAYFAWPGQPGDASESGLEAGLGFGVPLTGSASGPWLGARGLIGWPELSTSRPPWASSILTLGVNGLFESPWLAR